MEITKTEKILRLKEQNYILPGFFVDLFSLFWGEYAGNIGRTLICIFILFCSRRMPFSVYLGPCFCLHRVLLSRCSTLQ